MLFFYFLTDIVLQLYCKLLGKKTFESAFDIFSQFFTCARDCLDDGKSFILFRICGQIYFRIFGQINMLCGKC